MFATEEENGSSGGSGSQLAECPLAAPSVWPVGGIRGDLGVGAGVRADCQVTGQLRRRSEGQLERRQTLDGWARWPV